jgi:hypothetical protein
MTNALTHGDAMEKYRKKPVVIEAVQWFWPNETEGVCVNSVNEPERQGYIDTLEGRLIVSDGDWIIRGVNGEFYPCKPDIFEKTYELVDEEKKCQT